MACSVQSHRTTYSALHSIRLGRCIARNQWTLQLKNPHYRLYSPIWYPYELWIVHVGTSRHLIHVWTLFSVQSIPIFSFWEYSIMFMENIRVRDTFCHSKWSYWGSWLYSCAALSYKISTISPSFHGFQSLLLQQISRRVCLFLYILHLTNLSLFSILSRIFVWVSLLSSNSAIWLVSCGCSLSFLLINSHF